MSGRAGELAMGLLVATRDDDRDALRLATADIAALSADELRASLSDDAARMAFWIDVYNAAVRLQPPDALATRMGRFRLFRRTVIRVADQDLSLDAIEHGILRRSRWKLGLGYLGNPRPSAFERSHRVARVDPRIHFALNCGARSCPPIAAYRADRIDEQLNAATRSHLSAETKRAGRALRLPTVMLWFIGDFGGRDGLRRFLADHGVDADGRRLRFRRYDWSSTPGTWAPDEWTPDSRD